MNGKFFALPQERQEQIINAAYGVFSRNSYKNASMSRLADAGGVSKSLLFHYFLIKKNCICTFGNMHAGFTVKK